jgi:hypothetical protein
MLSKLKKFLPWWSKISIKLILSVIPFRTVLYKIGLLEHGTMNNPEYAYKVFMEHYRLAGRPKDFTCLELGPGDSISAAMIASAVGARMIYLIDVGNYATRKISTYKSLYEYLKSRGLNVTIDLGSFEALLVSCHAEYWVDGLKSLKKIPSDSVDIVFSQAVLEHIRRNEFEDYLRELYRICRSAAVCTHVIDLKDHLGDSLNNLRFSENYWESSIVSRAGFYTNRIRYGEMIGLFRQAGFKCEVISENKWDRMPIERKKLHKSFQALPEMDLLISEFTGRLIK